MADESGFNDRALSEPSEGALPKPQIEIIVDGNSVFKPGMKTYFVDDYDEDSGRYGATVMGALVSGWPGIKSAARAEAASATRQTMGRTVFIVFMAIS